MEKIAEKLKVLRHKKGYSQEELAELAGLNPRTIQRIENGETVPRGDSLQRLSQALQISPDELIDWTVKEDKNILTILNLSQLCFIAFPILGILVPLIIWLNQKDKVSEVDRLGKAILNFQITWTIFFFTLSILGLVLPFLRVQLNTPLSLIILGPILIYGYNIAIIVINTVLTMKEHKVFYKPSIKFLEV